MKTRCVRFALLIPILLAACTAQKSAEQEGQPIAVRDTLIDVAGHAMFLRVMGAGAPPVVIDVGIGESFEGWQPIADSLSKLTTVCFYDRAGYGQSGPGPLPRTGKRVVDELCTLLQEANIEPPYILVGHSLGGQHALILANERPELLAGLILLDPSPIDFVAGRRFTHLLDMAEEMTETWRQLAETAREAGDGWRAANFETIASEHEMMFSENASVLLDLDDLGSLPVTVIAAGLPNQAFGDSARAFQDFWVESNRELANLSTRGRFVLAHQSSHHLHREATGQVLEAIEEMVASVRYQH